MKLRKPKLVASLLCLLLATIVGCNSGDQANGDKGHGHDHGHDHHDHDHDKPKSLQAAISELREMWTKISTAMENDKTGEAHDPIHKVGRVLAAMDDLATETDLSEDKWNEVKQTTKDLVAAFREVDAAFHNDGDKKAAFDSAKSTIDTGIAELEKLLPLLGDGDHLENDDKEV